MIKKLKNTVPWTYVPSGFKGLQKTNQNEFRVKKVIKKVDKLYFKWKGYDYSFALIKRQYK